MYFTDGTPFFLGTALLAAIAIADLRFSSRGWRLFSKAGIVLGVLLVAVSSTPLSAWFYAVWGISAAWVLFDRRDALGLSTSSRMGVASMIALCVVAALLEMPSVLRPTVDVGDMDRFVVIGDSISAGTGGGITPWPKLLEEQYEVKVTDLSQAGAVLADAVSKAEGLALEHSQEYVFILEIGGNDVLQGTDYETFASGLEDLFSRVCGGGDKVFMLELPLPPFYNRYARAERDLARKYGAILIPRRFFVKVLTHTGATIDGIHLSESGHQLMLDTLWALIHPSESEGLDD